MKKVFTSLAIVAGLMFAATAAFGGQNIWSYVAKQFTGGGASLLNVDSTGNLLESNGALAINNVSGVPVVIKTGASRLVSINVISASGTIVAYDSATVASGVAANKVYTNTAATGQFVIDWPMASGIVVDPSSSVIAVKYN